MLKKVILLCLILVITLTNVSLAEAASKCSKKKPSDTPRLLRIDTKEHQAKLYFTSVEDNLTHYYIEYGFKEGDARYGDSFPAKAGSGHSVKRFIYSLNKNTTYYFRVRGGNGCRIGTWSDWERATTPKSGVTIKEF